MEKKLKKPSTTEIGNNFENRIADLYDRLGYTVEKNQRQTGNQIDIIISRNIDGIGVVKYAVECKHLNKNVGVTIVNNFVSVIKTVSAANGFSGGVVVTNNGFSNSAKEAAFAHPGITLMTESELEEKILLGVTPEKIIQEYEKSEIFEYYITQSGAGKVPGLHSSLTFSDIREPFIKWILSKQHGNAFVLGDYGTGKTTFLDRLRYELLKLFLKGESQQLPILFRLREFHKFSSLSEYLIQSFNENYRQVPDPAWLWSKVEEGSLVLLLDGFDEISIESNEKKRALQIANISPLLASASKSVISCRPSYFVSSEEFNEIVDRRFEDLVDDENGHIQGKNNVAEGVGDIYKQIRETVVGKISNADQYKRIKVNQYQVMNLVYLDKPKIMSYLQNFSNEFSSKLKASPKEVYEYLKKVYDITDLMRRPIILNMIVETLLTGRLDVKDTSMKVGPSAIYEIYTDAKLAMESEKGWMRRAFSPDERKEFAEVVAVSMFRNGALGIEFSEIGEIAQDYGDIAKIVRSSLVDRNIFEAIATDIVLCGFLTRVGDEFRFGHRSFMEFFVARHILGDILKTDRSEILTVEENIRHEILYYLASFIQFNEKA
ncbi:MAG: restriction endonuclease, partial [Cytophagales bacterium]|nr:restriction endonuclease [Cytophagales bacterium]